jgi:hypothetical protein
MDGWKRGWDRGGEIVDASRLKDGVVGGMNQI